MTNVVSTDNASPCFFIGYVMTIGQKKVMSRMCVSINKESALHVIDPSGLGGLVDPKDNCFGMLCLRRNFQSTKSSWI